MTVEHLLLALLDNEAAATVLRACGANLDAAARPAGIHRFHHAADPAARRRARNPADAGPSASCSVRCSTCRSSGKREVTGANVLVAIFSEQESQAVFLLKQQSIARIDVVNYIAHGISMPGHAEHPQDGEQDMQDEEGGESARPAIRWTPMPATSTNWLARGGSTPLVGREHEVERVAQILPAGAKNNPAGRRGGGSAKTAIAEGLAKRIVDGQVPTCWPTAYSTPSTWVPCRGYQVPRRLEKRFKALLNRLRKRPHAVLFIDEIHTIIGAGAASGG